MCQLRSSSGSNADRSSRRRHDVMSSETPARTETMMYEKNGHAWSRSYCDGRAGMIGVRMVEAEQVAARLGGALFGFTIIRRTHQKTPPRTLLGRVRQRVGRGHHAVAADQTRRSTRSDRFPPRAREWPRPPGSQATAPSRRLLVRAAGRRALVPEALGQVFLAAVGENRDDHRVDVVRATRSAPASAAPLEMPTNSPCRAS